MIEIVGESAPELLMESLWAMRVSAVAEPSRNGDVFTIQTPVIIKMLDPTRRVLFDPIRKANPYFHVMEFVWMMAGSNDVNWIEQFNSRYREYAEPGTNRVWAAYGHRWKHHFLLDQVARVISMLKKDPTTRRAVLGMWDPDSDLDPHNDLPCNTHIYFRVVNGRLDMTVCNRSNDLIWGALGANVVHMTMLQELVAQAAGLPLGIYRVFTNNLHIYRNMPGFEKIYDLTYSPNEYVLQHLPPVPLLHGQETYEDFVDDSLALVHGRSGYVVKTKWFFDVAIPMYEIYRDRKAGYLTDVNLIGAADWREACRLWGVWKDAERNS